jgi:hypothetical protein
MTLMAQSRSLGMMSNWLGGAFNSRAKKGDKNAGPPLQPVPAEAQRKALAFCINNSFKDEAFNLTPELLAHLTTDKWYDGDESALMADDSAWPVHDRVLGIQAMVMTRLLNPVTLGRVYDNEVRVPGDQDYITLPEVLDAIRVAVWNELDTWQDGPQFTARKPFLSSFRRNLQREHLDRLIDLTTNSRLSRSQPSYKPITDLATTQLGEIKAKIDSIASKPTLDPYSRSHLGQASIRIKKALDAGMLVDDGSRGGGGASIIILGSEAEKAK